MHALRLIGLLIALFSTSLFAHVQHLMTVKLYPQEHSIDVQDQLTFNNLTTPKTFTLNNTLTIKEVVGAKIKQLESNKEFATYELTPHSESVFIHYSGVIFDPVTDQQSNGLISTDGVTLFGSSYWFPAITDELLSFTMRVELPEQWLSVSQGIKESMPTAEIWTERLPQKTIYLMANKFKRYQLNNANMQAEVYLLNDEPELAKQFLNTTLQTIDMYSNMLGEYPYKKFAMVENFWETGFGMPSFTLLGPTVTHLPFIFYSSFPHEILHNWWGNSVYVDYKNGNWCEGLTTYLADHLMQTFRHNDSKYRQDTLKKYTNFIQTGTDYPLREFVYKEDNRAEVIGYNKGLMFFHMLKIKFGEQLFFQALQKFYQDNKFKTVSFPAIQTAFEEVTQQDLTTFFHQWVDLPGAPTLELTKVKKEQQTISFNLNQNGKHIYELLIPITITTQTGQQHSFKIKLNSRQQHYSFNITDAIQLKIDPHFDLFRRVVPAEIASSLSLAFGSSQDINVIISSPRYNLSAKEIEKLFPQQKINYSNQVVANKLNIVLGANANLNLQQYNTPELQFNSSIMIKGKEYTDKSVALILTKPHLPTVLYITAQKDMEQRVVQKAIHYGKYSAVVFDHEKNILKTSWSVFNSPLFYTFKD